MAKGFILQSMYHMENNVPVITLFGKLDNSETFLARIDSFFPYFFICEKDLDNASRLATFIPRKTDLHTMSGQPVVRLEFRNPGSLPDIRNHFFQNGIECYEADIRFVYRFLIDHGIRGSLELSGEFEKGASVDRVYRNPHLSPVKFSPVLKVLSIDIETDSQGTKIYAVSTYDGTTGRVYMLGVPGIDSINNGILFETESALLRQVFNDIRECDPDIITGWNVINFDFAFLERRCRMLKIPFRLGRTDKTPRFVTDETYTMSARLELPGRQVLDGIQLLRGAYYKLDDYSLETAAETILGETKIISGDDRGRKIDELFRLNKQKLAEYNLHDAILAFNILIKTGAIDLAVTRSLLTGMSLDRVGASVASFDFLYLMELRNRGYVAPCVAGPRGNHEVLGGYVLEASPGIYENVIVLDFRSLYPSIIMTFNIDPLMLVKEKTQTGDYIRAPNGALFKKDRGILPGILGELFPEREHAKKQGNKTVSTAIKILMNSFYGVLAAPGCRFYSVDIANAITYFGQYFLKKTAETAREMDYQVIYGDTDSIFVLAGTSDFTEAQRAGIKLRNTLNKFIGDLISREFGCESYLEIEFEKVYWKFFLPRVRSGMEGSKKRYAGLVDPDNPESLEFVGLETVRRDWTDLAKIVQRELLIRIFADKEVTDFLKNLVKNLKAGRYDDYLVYKKALRKSIEEYTKTTPPHVKAAKKQTRISSRLISYIITIDGPEPADQLQHPPDYQHYIDKQIAPVADSILGFLDKKFEDIIRPTQQLDLFDDMDG